MGTDLAGVLDAEFFAAGLALDLNAPGLGALPFGALGLGVFVFDTGEGLLTPAFFGCGSCTTLRGPELEFAFGLGAGAGRAFCAEDPVLGSANWGFF